jgi:hypothetical protein
LRACRSNLHRCSSCTPIPGHQGPVSAILPCHPAATPQPSTRPFTASRRVQCCRKLASSTTPTWTPGAAARHAAAPRRAPTAPRRAPPSQTNDRAAPRPSCIGAAHSKRHPPVAGPRLQVITKLLYLLNQGETFTKVGAAVAVGPRRGCGGRERSAGCGRGLGVCRGHGPGRSRGLAALRF